MAVLKKLLIGGVSLVAVVGIGTGIGVAVNNSRTEQGPVPSEGENTKPDGGKDDLTPVTIDLQKVVNEITPQNIVVKQEVTEASATKNQEEIKKSLYAFDVTVEQLQLDEETTKKLPKDTEVKFELNKLIKNGVSLNSGNLDVTIKATVKGKDNAQATTASKEVKLTGFKDIGETLKTYFADVKEGSISVIDLSKAKEKETFALTTIETLNQAPSSKRTRRTTETVETKQPNGLNKLFQMVNKKEESGEQDTTSTIEIKGTIKLEKITKQADTNEPLFHLVSGTKDPLKLVNNKAKDNAETALVDEIVVTNLLATSVKFDFNNFEEKDQAEFVKKYVSEATNKGFTASENSVSLKVDKKPPMAEKEISVGINPVLVRRIAEKHEIKANLIVTYGTESLAKTYSTAVNEGFKELTDAGIKFSIYSKKLEDVTETVEASKIKTEANKLSIFFDKDSVSTGVASTSLETDGTGMKKPIGEFILLASGDEGFKKNFTLGTVTSTMEAAHLQEEAQEGLQLDTRQKKWVSENWISFVGYSFGKDLKDKVLFIPTINLIHVAELKTQNMK